MGLFNWLFGGKEIKKELHDSGKEIKKELHDSGKEIKKEYHDNGMLFTEAEVINGKRSGYYKVYYENGNLSEWSYYKNGEAAIGSIWKKYFENGELQKKFSIVKEEGKFIEKLICEKYNQIEEKSKWDEVHYYDSGRVMKRIKVVDTPLPLYFSEDSYVGEKLKKTNLKLIESNCEYAEILRDDIDNTREYVKGDYYVDYELEGIMSSSERESILIYFDKNNIELGGNVDIDQIVPNGIDLIKCDRKLRAFFEINKQPDRLKNIQYIKDLSIEEKINVLSNKNIYKKAEKIKKYYKDPKISKSKKRVNKVDLSYKNNTAYYKNKVFSGVLFELSDDGRLKQETEMEKGKANGLSIEYNTQDFTFHYDVDKDNLKDVVKKAVKHVKKEESRYQTKKIKIVSGYKNNKLHGMLEQYWSNDKLRLQIEYKEGKKHGIWNTFYKEGELESSLKCLNNKEEGQSLFFRENGNLDTVGYWENGKKNGWFENFQECIDVTQIEGQRTYTERPDGPLTVEAAGRFKNDERAGLWYEFRNACYGGGGIFPFYCDKIIDIENNREIDLDSLNEDSYDKDFIKMSNLE